MTKAFMVFLLLTLFDALVLSILPTKRELRVLLAKDKVYGIYYPQEKSDNNFSQSP